MWKPVGFAAPFRQTDAERPPTVGLILRFPPNRRLGPPQRRFRGLGAMGSTLRWDLGEKDGKVGMGLGAGFVATGVEHQQDDGEQADRRACDAGEMVIHRRRGQCRSADDGTDRIAEMKAICTAAPAISSPPPSPACTISSCCGDELKNSAKPMMNVSNAVVA